MTPFLPTFGLRFRRRPLAAVLAVLSGLLVLARWPDAPPARAAEPARSFDVRAFGAVGDGRTPDTKAIQDALDAAARAGGGEVDAPAGTFLVGSLKLGSHVTLRLEAGATLQGSPSAADYPTATVRFEGEDVAGHQAMLHAENQTDVAVVGAGTLAGDAALGSLRQPRGPLVIELTGCRRARLEGFHVRYHRLWSIHLLDCADVAARGLDVRSTGTNGDGVDVESSTDVTIDRCTMDTGDDCVALKSGRGLAAYRRHRPTARVRVTGCTLGSSYAPIGLGTEMSGGIKDVRVEHCAFTRGANAVFLKSRIGRGGVIENVLIDDVRSAGTKTFLGIDLIDKGIVGTQPVPGDEGVPAVKNVRIRSVTVRGGDLVDGLKIPEKRPLDGLWLTDVHGSARRGISLANVTGLRLKNVDVSVAEGPAVDLHNVTPAGPDAAIPPAAGPSPVWDKERFRAPPPEARPLVRWWWFGPAVTEAEIRREIGAMKAGGFGGFELQNTYPLATGTNPPGVTNLPFLSPEHLRMIGAAAREARAAGLRMDLTLGSGWPYGGATTPIDQAAGRLRVAQGAAPALRDGESLIGAVTAGGVTTSFVAGRTRMQVKRPALGAEGFVVDHLDARAVNHFLDTVARPMVDACRPDPPYALFCDSLESYGEDWTPSLPDEFRRRRGYDLRPLLPALTGDTVPDAAEVRHDWGRTLTELFDENFMRPLADFAHARGSRFRIQAYGVPAAGESSCLAADLPEGEGSAWREFRPTRYASSAAHLAGVPVASSETFTWLHPPVFRATPLDIKAEANQHFLQGVNQLVCHGWPYSPPEAGEPGWSFYAAGVFSDHNPWWPVMPDVTAYLTRCSYLLRQGRPANDVAVYLPNDDAWARFAPGRASLTDALGQQLGPDVVANVLDAGYGLDLFDDGILAARGRADKGALAFGDLRYRVVVLPGVERVPPATLAVLDAFVRGGGTLIATRTIPSRAPGYRAAPAEQQAVRDGAARLFGGARPLALFVRDERDLPAALRGHLPPDVALDPPDPAVGFVHRRTDSGDLYFLANTSNRPVRFTARFRGARAAAELWDPMTGDTAAALPVTGGAVRLALDAYGSTAVDLSDGWTVRFPGDAAARPVGKLHSWTDDPATRAFSGVATYERVVTVTPAMLAGGARLVLGFGNALPEATPPETRAAPGFAAGLAPPVREAAVVFVNGRRVGSVWCPPYAIDVSRYLRAGDNAVRVDVANTAVNALVGRFPNYDDAGLAKEFGRRFAPAGAGAFQPVASGLLGPVTLTAQAPP